MEDDDGDSPVIRRAVGTLLAAALMVIAGIAMWACTSNRVTLRNSSGETLRAVHLSIREAATGRLVLEEAELELRDGESLSFRFRGATVVNADVAFSVEGARMEPGAVATDLWSGESWLLTVDACRSLQSSYD